MFPFGDRKMNKAIFCHSGVIRGETPMHESLNCKGPKQLPEIRLCCDATAAAAEWGERKIHNYHVTLNTVDSSG